MNINLSIVIVTFNCGGFIQRFLDELLSSLADLNNYELLILDNNSTDDTVKIINDIAHHTVKLISSPVNHGFSKGNNILIEKAAYEHILLLNPDVFGFNPSFWTKAFELWDHKNPMFIKLLNEDLTFQDCVGDVAGPMRVINRVVRPINYADVKQPVAVGMGIMAFMLVTRATFEKVGLLSEDYHMYAEDMDWCYRAGKLGYTIIYEPRLQLIHIGGASAKTTQSVIKTLLIKYDSQKKFIKKNYSGINRFLSLILTGIMVFKLNYKSRWRK